MALAATMTLSSCGDDFLVLEPVGAVTKATLTSPEGVDYALTKAYANFYNPGKNAFAVPFANYAYGDVYGGDANKGSEFADQSDFTDIETYSFNASNSYLQAKYRFVYDGVKYANDAEDIARATAEAGLITEAQLNLVLAQTAFIRGVFYFEGVKVFGAAIPYVSYEASISSTDPKVSNVDESGNYIFIWDNIIADLQYAYQNLPDTWASGQQGRANKWAAAGMLAKVLIYQASPYGGVENGANKVAMPRVTSSNWPILMRSSGQLVRATGPASLYSTSRHLSLAQPTIRHQH